jgi:demethoxyubiquinone hydroxylase (CLK1/Coq7/Cat5 family)
MALLRKSKLLAKLRDEEVHHIAWIEKLIKKSICA